MRLLARMHVSMCEHKPPADAPGAYLTLWAIASAGIIAHNSTLHLPMVERALVCSDGDAQAVSSALTASGHPMPEDAVRRATNRAHTIRSPGRFAWLMPGVQMATLEGLAMREARRFRTHRIARQSHLAKAGSLEHAVAWLEGLKTGLNDFGTGTGMEAYPEPLAEQLGWLAPVPFGFYSDAAVNCSVDSSGTPTGGYAVWALEAEPGGASKRAPSHPTGIADLILWRCQSPTKLPRDFYERARPWWDAWAPNHQTYDRPVGSTLLGSLWLDDMQYAIEDALVRGIEGDFVQTGVLTGGSLLFASGVLHAHRANRSIWGFDRCCITTYYLLLTTYWPS